MPPGKVVLQQPVIRHLGRGGGAATRVARSRCCPDRGAAVAQTACQRSLQIKERERTNYGRKMEFLNMFYLIKIHILKIYSMPLFSCIQKKGTKSTDIELTFEFRVSM